MKKTIFMLIFILSMASAAAQDFNAHVEWNNIDENFNIDMNAEAAYVIATIDIDSQRIYNNYDERQITNIKEVHTTASDNAILEVIADLLNNNIGSDNHVFSTKAFKEANITVSRFVNEIGYSIYNSFIKPLYIEQEINRRLYRKLDTKGYECQIVEDMIKEGYFESHICYDKGIKKTIYKEAILR